MSHTNLFIVSWWVSVLIIIALSISRIFQNKATKAATDRFGKQLQANPELGEAFAQTLYKPVGWIDVAPDLGNKNVLTLLGRLPDRVVPFLIHYRQQVSNDSYLFVTTVDYLRPNARSHELIRLPRQSYSVTRITYNLNFVVRLDTLKKQLIVLSDLYITLIDKNLRADFAMAVSERLQM